MMFFPRADLFVLLRIGKTQAFYFFRAGPVHAYLRTTFSPATPYLTKTQAFPAPVPLFTKGMPTAYAHVTGGARHPPRFHREGKLELTEESRLAQP